jgi:aryl-alcohol dehydrogenase-like predicted oxidoreductase
VPAARVQVAWDAIIATKGGWERPGPSQMHNASPKHLIEALEGIRTFMRV